MLKEKPLTINIKYKSIKKLLNTQLGILFRNWLFQGILYMDLPEIIFKLVITLLLSLFFLVVLISITKLLISSIIAAVFISHTINWLFNGHFYVVMRYFRAKTDINKMQTYIERLKIIGNRYKFINSIAIFGSFARKESNSFSDLDVRWLPVSGVFNTFLTLLLAFRERSYAFIYRIPLDLYVITNHSQIFKLREKNPLIVKDKDDKLLKWLHL